MFSFRSSFLPVNAKLALIFAALASSLAYAVDNNPAPFPRKAAAILVQGSSDQPDKNGVPAWLNDVNAMNSLFTNATYGYTYGIQKLTTAGAGTSQTTSANVQSAFANAGTAMWIYPVAAQNLVYYQSSHGGLGTSNKNSTLDFNGTSVSADTYTNWITSNLPQGNQQYSTNGNTNTTCVRSMTYIYDSCFSGGYIYDLTTLLADPATRKLYFPFLSDVTVMTAADYNECALSAPGNTGGTFSQALYGFTDTNKTPAQAVTGALQTSSQISAYQVYQTAAQNDVSNNNVAYAVNAAFGSGDNATMYQTGSRPDGSGQYQHPLYRHVSFYPALTLIPTLADPTMGVALSAEPNSIDMRLGSSQAPGNGPVPLQMSIYGVPSGDTLMVSRQKNTWDTMNPEPIFADQFVPYYIFQMQMLNGSTYSGGSISMYYNQLTDPTQIAVYPFDIFEELSPDSGWIDLGAVQNFSDQSLTADLNGSLGEFALIIVPEPAGFGLLVLTCMAMGRRKSRMR